MRVSKVLIFSLFCILTIFLFRYYFFIIDACFSDSCRHSKILQVPQTSIRAEVVPYNLYQYSPILFYFIDLPFLFILIFSRNIVALNKLLLTVWGIQPSYDIFFLIGVAYFFWFYRIGFFGLLVAFFTKLEFTVLVVGSWLFFWKRTKYFHSSALFVAIALFTLLSLLCSTITDTALISNPVEGKFQGQENTITRFLGYLLMPVSSVFSYQLDLSWQSNLIRLQSIVSAFILVSQLKSVKTLSIYVFVCTVIAVIVDFYQLRYVILFLTVYFLYLNQSKYSIPINHNQNLSKEQTT